jgi:hypothetical protein
LILDKNLILSDAQAVTSVGTHLSENVIDTVEVGDAVNELYFVACVETACTSADAATVEVQLVTDSDSAISSPTVLWSSGAIPKASLVDKYCFGIVRLPKPERVERYIAAQIIVGTAALTAGAFDIYLTDNPQTNI